MSDNPRPEFLPDEDAINKMLRKQMKEADTYRTQMLELARTVDHIRFMLEVSTATAETRPDTALATASGEIADFICNMCKEPGSEAINMMRAIQMGLAGVWRITDAAYRGFTALSDPLVDKSTPIEI